MLAQTPVAELKAERTGSIQMGNGVLCVSEMKVRQRSVWTQKISLLNGCERPKVFISYLFVDIEK